MTERMTTRAKNATQRPGLIDLSPPALGDSEPTVVKRRTKAKKAADDEKKALEDQKRGEDEERKKVALKEAFGRIADMEKTLKDDQQSQEANAPKPRRPQPRAANAEPRGPQRAAKGGEDDDVFTGPVSGTVGDVELASDDEDKVQPMKPKGRKGKAKAKAAPKPVKTSVRDAINAAGSEAPISVTGGNSRDVSTELDVDALAGGPRGQTQKPTQTHTHPLTAGEGRTSECVR
ncbi:hypothetical protein BV22DRAFT_1135112 [Leucogyrophana mollusca]|uniref:Uncharacterized protein n=1 Tax=Leucogyrophana mollusca TaxID=85980 RepID=A0ACB8AWM9_9AGAM|nr:hypothetical protein BV22DRAFT_1135112 [Leucogyrophana mollusca]